MGNAKSVMDLGACARDPTCVYSIAPAPLLTRHGTAKLVRVEASDGRARGPSAPPLSPPEHPAAGCRFAQPGIQSGRLERRDAGPRDCPCFAKAVSGQRWSSGLASSLAPDPTT